ncbi:MAG TPA: sodium:solute symporter family protein, partial [bacterium]|nr:sodium:solute symporter family protein [bacterium]
GGVSSILAGMSVTLLWEIWDLKSVNFILPLVGQSTIPTIYPSLILSVLALIVVSYFTGPPESEKVRRFIKRA